MIAIAFQLKYSPCMFSLVYVCINKLILPNHYLSLFVFCYLICMFRLMSLLLSFVYLYFTFYCLFIAHCSFRIEHPVFFMYMVFTSFVFFITVYFSCTIPKIPGTRWLLALERMTKRYSIHFRDTSCILFPSISSPLKMAWGSDGEC